MKTITFQVIEGVDKGRVYRDLSVPVSIGREEGNGMRLNDVAHQPFSRQGAVRRRRCNRHRPREHQWHPHQRRPDSDSPAAARRPRRRRPVGSAWQH